MTAAIFGIIGVVVGALATAGTQFALEWRRERGDFLVGIRLLEVALLQTEGSILAALESNAWAIGYKTTIEPHWREFAHAVAKGLRRKEWTVLGMAITSGDMAAARFAWRLSEAPAVSLTEEDRRALEVIRLPITLAVAIVGNYSGGSSAEIDVSAVLDQRGVAAAVGPER